MTTYPAKIDTVISLPAAQDNITPISGDIYNNLRNAVLALEAELGIKPSGIYTTVKNRLDTLEALLGASATLSPLFFSGAPLNGQTVIFNNGAWSPGTDFGAQNLITSGALSSNSLTLSSNATFIGTSGVSISSAGQGIIFFDSSSGKFKASQDGYAFVDLINSGGGGGGSPTGAAGGDLSGTYPNPTVAEIGNAPLKTFPVFDTGIDVGNVLTVVSGSLGSAIAIDPATNNKYILRNGLKDILVIPAGYSSANASLSISWLNASYVGDMVYGDGSLWITATVGASNYLFRVNSTTGAQIASVSFSSGGGYNYPLAYDSSLNKIWLGNTHAVRIDCATNTQDLTSYFSNGVSSLLVDDGVLWIGSSAAAQIVKTNLSTGGIINVINISGAPSNSYIKSLIYDQGFDKIYAINGQNYQLGLFRINATTAAYESSYTVPAAGITNLQGLSFDSAAGILFISASSYSPTQQPFMLSISNPESAPLLQTQVAIRGPNNQETISKLVFDSSIPYTFGYGNDYYVNVVKQYGAFGGAGILFNNISMTALLDYKTITTVSNTLIQDSTGQSQNNVLTLSSSNQANWLPLNVAAASLSNNVNITSAPYQVLIDDYLIGVSSGGTITLETSPNYGRLIIIKDTTGSAATSNIIIDPSFGTTGITIDGANTYTLAVNYASLTLIFTGNAWSII